jgi:hypothetical protein
MRTTAAKLSAFGLILAAVFGVAWTIGVAIGPLDTSSASGGTGQGGHSHDQAADGTKPIPALPPPVELSGQSTTANGYRLDIGRDVLTAGTTEQFAFRITGPDGAPLTHFTVDNDARLSLIAVRHDATDYQHLFPTMSGDGTWTTPLNLHSAGSYRLLADFTPEAGPHTILGTTIHAPGTYQPQPNSPHQTNTVDDYQARLDGNLTPGRASPVTITLFRNGTPVTDLQLLPDVTADLSTLRCTDLGYQHTYTTNTGPRLRFTVTVPTPGCYRLFLTIRHHDTTRTLDFTADAT